MITEANWTSCFYQSKQLKAFISLGADASGDILYFLTLTDPENTKEYFQWDYHCLDVALGELNHRYSHWDLVDGEEVSSEGGCDSCAAH